MPGDIPRNPFPGLRPFESHESALFFGRDEQCDELLARLARRRLVAVVGASGSGKSSLVRAGLLPALERGYLPSAGSSWQIATFRPGGNPTANLIEALLASALQNTGQPPIARQTLSDLLAASSLGLVSAAKRLLGDQQRSLLVLVDQFEEIFRFRSLAEGASASEEAVECVDMLLAAAAQDDVPVYVVLTMRSDYLGDCARFAGLPEALNDSQFLVPHMTREQLRAAIEGPVAVGGGRIAPGVVQRLLHDVDALAGRLSSAAKSEKSDEYDHDQLPVLQHALMRMWEVSSQARAKGRAIDLDHYEAPPVETIHHALDRHSEEIYTSLPSDYHRDVARLVFQRLTERDAENREVRRPTPLTELVAVAVGAAPPNRRDETPAAVNSVLKAFAAEGCAFVIINAQQDVDIAHESFIRKWRRLREWLGQEAQSRRIYLRLAETAGQWDQGSASLYRGPELAEADRWWKKESPSPAWAQRYDERLDTVDRFLAKSRLMRRLRLSAAAAGALATVLIAVLMTLLWGQARAEAERARTAEGRAVTAEEDARTARNNARVEAEKNKEALDLLRQAVEAGRAGNAQLAADLRKQSEAAAQLAGKQDIYTKAELREIEDLRKTAGDRAAELKTTRGQLDTAKDQLNQATSEREKLQAELTRVRAASANPSGAEQIATLQRERDNDRKESAATIAKLQAEITDLKARVSELSSGGSSGAPANEPGSPAASFESGVRAYDLRNYVQSIRFLQDAVERQSKSKSAPKEVRMSGTRFVPYAPNSYLAATLFDMKSDCSVVMPLLKAAQNEPVPADIRSKLQDARKQCGLAAP